MCVTAQCVNDVNNMDPVLHLLLACWTGTLIPRALLCMCACTCVYVYVCVLEHVPPVHKYGPA